MRKLRAAFVGVVLALPAALVLPGAVPAAASAPACSGIPPVAGWSVSVPNGNAHGGSSVSLTQQTQLGGPSFGSGGTVYFSDASGQPSSSVSVGFGGTSSNTITVSAPSSARSGHVKVCLGNDNQLYDAGMYTFNPSVSSGSQSAAEGATVSVGGNYYNNHLAVSVGGCGATLTGFTESVIQFKVPGPADACSGPVSVSETAADGTGLSASGGQVTVIPQIGSVSCSDPCYPGQTVTVGGTGFGSQGSWNLGGVGGSWSGSDSSFSFRAPDGTEGGSLTVTNDVGASAGPTGSVSIYPHISGLSPSSAKDGDTVTINGQDFGSSPGTVTLGGQQLDASNLSGWGMDKITFSVPAGAVPGSVGVTTADGRGAVNSANLSLVPVISSVDPASASAGSYVTITGSTFGQNGGSVTIGGKPAQIADWADTAIIAVVPSGASTGKLIVNSGYGQSVTWGKTFTVTAGGSTTGSSSSSGGYSNYTNSGTLNVKPNYGFLPLPKAPPGVAFHITAPATDVKPGSSVDMTVNLAINNKPVAGATITFQVATSPGSDTALSAPSAVTDQNGIAHVTLKTSKKAGQTIVIAHSGAFADQIRVVSLAPTASLGTTILKTTSSLDPHILIPFIGALVLAVLLLLGTVILQFAVHRRQRIPAPVATPVDAVPVAVATEAVAETVAEPKPRKPRAPRAARPRKPKIVVTPQPEPEADVEPITLDLAAGAEDIAPVIPLRADVVEPMVEPKITRTRARAKARD